MAWWLTYWPIVAMAVAWVLVSCLLARLLFGLDDDDLADVDVFDDTWPGVA